MNRAVIFDRDGTLVRAFPEGDTTRGPRTIEEIYYLPGVQEACRVLRRARYRLVGVTNQPDVARGLVTASSVEVVNHEILCEIPLDAIYCCPHDGGACACRKPRPGMIWRAAVEHELELSGCWLVGDREHDREAAIRAGIPQSQAIKITTNQGIEEAVKCILATTR